MSNLQAKKSVINTIDSIGKLAEHMLALDEHVDCPVTHRFAKGCYLREIFMPANTIIVGKIHATEHFNIILSGSATVVTVEGREYIKAPHTFVSAPGIQKVVWTHEDCVWQTVHVTEKTEVDEIEKEVIMEDYDQALIENLIERLSS